MAFSKSFIAIIFLLNLTPAPKIEPQRVKIMAVGDNLIHNSVLRAANLGKNKYNFEYLYEPMRKTINDFDIKIINQETILVKEPKNYTAKFPFFASPYAVGEALIKSGFNVIAQANNHSMDKGERGILDSVEFWEKYPEITMLGIYKNLDDFNKITIRETKGIKIAYLNYTYGLNGFQVPKKKTLFSKNFI